MNLLIIIVVLALIFDFINGFHDAANAITNIVSTKVLTPFQAVLWAAFFNFVAFFIAKFIIGGFGIANTVAKTVNVDMIPDPTMMLIIVLSGLVAAIIWNLFTRWSGIPSSSFHTLIGGFAGAAIVAFGGFGSINVGVICLIAAFILLSPLIGMLMAFLLSLLVAHSCKHSSPVRAKKRFKRLQLVSSALFSVGHGLNDSQKVMGIIAVAMIATGAIDAVNDAPFRVPMACFAAISLGTMCGGWRIVKTMGTKITKISYQGGMIADTAAALTLYLTEILEVPVSTTHTVTGAIIGVGATNRLSAVRWGITKKMLWAWILTIPVSAVIAGAVYYFFDFFGILGL